MLPALTLALFYIAIYTRLMRASMLEVYGLDFVAPPRQGPDRSARIAYRHVLRNALLPVVTVLGLQFGALLGGAVVVETVFGWPGLGRLAFDAVLAARLQPAARHPAALSRVVVVAVNLVGRPALRAARSADRGYQ